MFSIFRLLPLCLLPHAGQKCRPAFCVVELVQLKGLISLLKVCPLLLVQHAIERHVLRAGDALKSSILARLVLMLCVNRLPGAVLMALGSGLMLRLLPPALFLVFATAALLVPLRHGSRQGLDFGLYYGRCYGNARRAGAGIGRAGAAWQCASGIFPADAVAEWPAAKTSCCPPASPLAADRPALKPRIDRSAPCWLLYRDKCSK